MNYTDEQLAALADKGAEAAQIIPGMPVMMMDRQQLLTFARAVLDGAAEMRPKDDEWNYVPVGAELRTGDQVFNPAEGKWTSVNTHNIGYPNPREWWPVRRKGLAHDDSFIRKEGELPAPHAEKLPLIIRELSRCAPNQIDDIMASLEAQVKDAASLWKHINREWAEKGGGKTEGTNMPAAPQPFRPTFTAGRINPPPFGEWHRSDFSPEMLPEGWRPLLLGENWIAGDEIKRVYSQVWEVGRENTGDILGRPCDSATAHCRTRRPLPPVPKESPKVPEPLPMLADPLMGRKKPQPPEGYHLREFDENESVPDGSKYRRRETSRPNEWWDLPPQSLAKDYNIYACPDTETPEDQFHAFMRKCAEDYKELTGKDYPLPAKKPCTPTPQPV